MAVNPDVDALRKAMKGFGTDEDTLIKVALKYTQKERIKLKNDYVSAYGRELLKDFEGDISGNFLVTMKALFTDPIEYDADELYRAMKGAGTNEDTLIEIIASRPGWLLKKIKKKYKEKYKNELEDDVADDTSGSFKKLLVSLLQCDRSTNEDPDIDSCKEVVEELYKAGEKRLGTDEPIFNKHFAKLSPTELMVVAREYHKAYRKSLYDVIASEYSRDVKKLLQTIMYSLISPSEYFATRIYKAIKGAGTDDKMLIRVIVTRHEIDMSTIKQYFKQLYGKDMVKEVEDDVSGDYKKLLIGLLNKSKNE